MTQQMQEEYEQFKREKINPLERAGDFFGGVDERIDFLAAKTFQTLDGVNNAVKSIEDIKRAIAGIELAEGVGILTKEIEQIPYSYTLAALQGIRMAEDAPFAGYVKSVMIHWPDGCNALVDVRIGHGSKQFCPRTEGQYLALNNATPFFYFNEWVNDNEEIWVEMRNGDAINPHTITVAITIERTI